MPGQRLQLGVELAGPPARVAGERARPARHADELGDLAAVAHEPDAAEDRHPGPGGVLELAEDEQRVGLDRSAGADQRLLADERRELGRDLADDELAGAIEDEPQRALVAVLADEDDGPGEVRIGERRAGDEQLSA